MFDCVGNALVVKTLLLTVHVFTKVLDSPSGSCPARSLPHPSLGVLWGRDRFYGLCKKWLEAVVVGPLSSYCVSHVDVELHRWKV